ncbi:MAG: AAA family ATPase [Chloroflexota bacterium]
MDFDTPTNPFSFGSLALDDAFADREREVAELTSDIRNGQDVVVFAPRRCGKSSLIWRVERVLAVERVLVAQVDLMTTPTKESLAAALAKSIFEQIASPLERAREKALAPFRSLQLQPTISVNPNDGSFSFSFGVAQRQADIDTTLKRLLELPAELGGARSRRTALVMDEFQEIVEIDPGMPKLLRSAFQTQTEVAHVYLGSKHHIMKQIFNDANEPFWRSAKSVELGMIPVAPFADFIHERFRATEKSVETQVVDELLALTGGHPYATQELCYFLWEQVDGTGPASSTHLDQALAAVLHSEHAHFSLLWDNASAVQRTLLLALSRETGRPFTADYRERHELPATTNVQKALRALVKREIVAGEGGVYRIVEPFLAEWLRANIDGVSPS